MKEFWHPTDKMHVEGEENLERVRALNEEQKYVLFAPNHLKPSGSLMSDIRAKLVLAEDYPALDRVLQEQGIGSRVVLKGDTNVDTKDSKVKTALYDIHRFAFSRVARLLSEGITMNVNRKDPNRAIVKNISSIREMIRTVQEQENLVLFPYGDWYKSREQEFLEEEDLAGKETFVRGKSLNNGFVRLARAANVPIVPTYLEKGDEGWIIRFGEFINAHDGEEGEIAKKYLAAMRSLRG